METQTLLFLAEHRTRGSSPRTIEGYRRDLDRFRAWLVAEGRPTTVTEVRREDVLMFPDMLLTLPVTERRPNPQAPRIVSARLTKRGARDASSSGFGW